MSVFILLVLQSVGTNHLVRQILIATVLYFAGRIEDFVVSKSYCFVRCLGRGLHNSKA